ncbi:lipopolysaccharide biosynthesis protein [Wenjunlia vitaminophila]|uniref:Lipopolysaccharide biosynthesis protein n=1 Tax=Wenjunlia vitaminophila TaxID=76728 RepID=A0A0T6LKP4_WENVI|nr:lipopolysaccharide biosynthesis protein [Wenjunlia vitaminophila]KRV46675.1 lipopolysaccharide biosynthesis protein [Wenjunlia vitaminophila]
MTRATRFDDAYEEPDQLRDQLRQLLRYRGLVVLGLLLGLLGAGAVSVTGSDDYTSTGEVVVQAISTAPFETGGVSADKQLSMGTEKRIAQSATVASRAARRLGGGERPAALRRGLRVSNPPDTQTLRFEYTASSPERAAELVNAFVDSYLEYREDAAVRRINTTVDKLDDELRPLVEQREELDRKIAETSDGPAKDTAEAERSSLVTYITGVQNRISNLKSLDTTPGDVVREGEPPAYPSGPGLAMLLLVGGVLGLATGLLLAWVRSVLEPRVRSVTDVQRILHAPVLGVLPRDRGETGLLVVGHARHSGLAEAYRTVAFRIAHDQGFGGRGSLLVVAPRDLRENRDAAALAVNLSGALTEIGHEVVLVEADLRNPRLATQLPVIGVPPTPDVAAWPQARPFPVDAGEAGRFGLIPGRRVPNVARALSSPQMGRVLAAPAGPEQSVVVVTRPLLVHADGLAMAKRVNGVLVVCDLTETRRDDLDRMAELITGAGGRVLGAVLVPGDRRGPLRRLVDAGPAQHTPRRGGDPWRGPADASTHRGGAAGWHGDDGPLAYRR